MAKTDEKSEIYAAKAADSANEGGVAAPDPQKEAVIAGILYRELRNLRNGALVQGDPTHGERTLIDGTFDLRAIAHAVIAAL